MEARAAHARLVALWAIDPGALVRPKGEYLLADLLADWMESSSGPKPSPKDKRQRVEYLLSKQMIETLRPWWPMPASAYSTVEFMSWHGLFDETIKKKDGEIYSQSTIHHLRVRLLKAFQWGEIHAKVPKGTCEHLLLVSKQPMKVGIPWKRRKSVKVEYVQAVVRHLTFHKRRGLYSLIKCLWWTGARVEELTNMTVGAVQTTGRLEAPRGASISLGRYKVWGAVIDKHKTEAHGYDRVLFFGPKCQKVLAPLLAGRSPEEPLFDLHEGLSAARKKNYSRFISSYTFWQVIRCACIKSEVPHWYPRQLRKSCAVRVQARFNHDSARAYIGHSKKSVTHRYTGEDLVAAAKVAAKMG